MFQLLLTNTRPGGERGYKRIVVSKNQPRRGTHFSIWKRGILMLGLERIEEIIRGALVKTKEWRG
jgi:hypothetical protein